MTTRPWPATVSILADEQRVIEPPADSTALDDGAVGLEQVDRAGAPMQVFTVQIWAPDDASLRGWIGWAVTHADRWFSAPGIGRARIRGGVAGVQLRRSVDASEGRAGRGAGRRRDPEAVGGLV